MKPSITKASRPPPAWVPTSKDDFVRLDCLLHIEESHGIARRLIEDGAIPAFKKDLATYKREKHRENRKALLGETLGVVIGNALFGFLKEKPVAYSRSKPRYKGHTYLKDEYESKLDTRDVALVVDALETQGYLDNYKAPQNTSLTHVSMFRATPKLVALLKRAMPFDVGGLLGYSTKEVPFVTLRDFKPSDMRLVFGETCETKNLESLGRLWASVNGMHKTTHPDEILFRWEWFKRSGFRFRGDWYHLGRLYHPLSEWPLEKRKLIQVDSNPTVEWDFKALHINLLYSHFTGKPYVGDAYAIPVYPYNVDKEMGRKLAKLVANVGAINSESLSQAVGSVNGQIYGYDDKGTWVKSRKPELRDWLEKSGISINKEVIETFVEYHKPVAEYFFGTGTGLVLQRMDSQILVRVLRTFVDKGYWIVPFHDSFRVEVAKESLLIETMKKAFFEETGINISNSYISRK